MVVCVCCRIFRTCRYSLSYFWVWGMCPLKMDGSIAKKNSFLRGDIPGAFFGRAEAALAQPMADLQVPGWNTLSGSLKMIQMYPWLVAWNIFYFPTSRYWDIYTVDSIDKAVDMWLLWYGYGCHIFIIIIHFVTMIPWKGANRVHWPWGSASGGFPTIRWRGFTKEGQCPGFWEIGMERICLGYRGHKIVCSPQENTKIVT